jgi:hypothetical protein
MKKHLFTLFIFFLFSACVKDKPENAVQPAVQLSSARKVYVINEGVFPNNNASVSLYDPGTGQVIEDIYAAQNANAAVGDVAQSLSWANSAYYLVVNNSGKILVCDSRFKKTGQISGLSSPRYLLQVTNQKAYVSDYNANAISIINLNSNLKTGAIPCPGWTERMALIYSKAFVTNIRRNYVYVVNMVTDVITDSIFVGLNSGNIVLDRQDKLWVLSGGDNANAIPARLLKLNPLSLAVESSMTFANTDSPVNLCLNRTKDTLYFLNKGIYRMAVSESALPVAPLVTGGTKNFYGLGLNPNDYSIYAADALDFNQRSTIYIYDQQGQQKSVFKAGINANGFYFE